MKYIQTFLLLAMIVIVSSTIAQNGFTQADRDLIVRNAEEIKAGQIVMKIQFESVDKRMDEMRIDTNKRFDQLLMFMGWIIGAFITITVSSILNAWWDRRSSMRPIEKRTKEVEDDIIELKKGTRLEKVITAFQDLAKDNPKVAEILKNNHLL